MHSNSEMKKCCKCNIKKPKNNYYTNLARKDNCSVYCIECINIRGNFNKIYVHAPTNFIFIAKF